MRSCRVCEHWAGSTVATCGSIHAGRLEIRTAVVNMLWNWLRCLANVPNSGMIVTGSAFAIAHRELVIKLANQHKLPTVYPIRFFVAAGGLISYGPDAIDPHRRAAGYVDRILKGEKPADLPVQNPTKYELVINLNTAKALGLSIPDNLLALAGEVIE